MNLNVNQNVSNQTVQFQQKQVKNDKVSFSGSRFISVLEQKMINSGDTILLGGKIEKWNQAVGETTYKQDSSLLRQAARRIKEFFKNNELSQINLTTDIDPRTGLHSTTLDFIDNTAKNKLNVNKKIPQITLYREMDHIAMKPKENSEMQFINIVMPKPSKDIQEVIGKNSEAIESVTIPVSSLKRPTAKDQRAIEPANGLRYIDDVTKSILEPIKRLVQHKDGVESAQKSMIAGTYAPPAKSGSVIMKEKEAQNPALNNAKAQLESLFKLDYKG